MERGTVKCSFTLVPRPLHKQDSLLSEWGWENVHPHTKAPSQIIPYIIHKGYKAPNDKNPRRKHLRRTLNDAGVASDFLETVFIKDTMHRVQRD